MLNSTKMSMGFGLCKCKECRHVFKKHRKNGFRAYQYRRIIKQLRRDKTKEDIDFTTCRYTD